MTISQILVKMIDYSAGNRKDIHHLMKVHSYARIIGKGEGLSEELQKITEIAAIVHDIACPLCRIKYGNTNGKYQEAEGPALTESFLADTGLTREEIARIAYLVGHHHTYEGVEGLDYQILLEADYLVNADESGYSRENILHMRDTVFQTKTGTALLESIYLK
ncbi:phosphohydrolase [Oscillospiraceae bacterium Marseille-Q3528]|nr:phosphohydrolase [Oscillospiraceae bacterium Marseille-Q3528]